MSRLTDFINTHEEFNFYPVYRWVDFGTGNGIVVNNLKWNEIASEKIAIDKINQNIKNGWQFYGEIDVILNIKRDLFTSFDCIEHFSKNDGIDFIKKIDEWFKFKLFFTPRGFLKQDEETHPELIKINPWQIHLSGWDVDDFNDLGYETIILPKFHYPPSLGKYFDAIIAYKIN